MPGIGVKPGIGVMPGIGVKPGGGVKPGIGVMPGIGVKPGGVPPGGGPVVLPATKPGNGIGWSHPNPGPTGGAGIVVKSIGQTLGMEGGSVTSGSGKLYPGGADSPPDVGNAMPPRAPAPPGAGPTLPPGRPGGSQWPTRAGKISWTTLVTENTSGGTAAGAGVARSVSGSGACAGPRH